MAAPQKISSIIINDSHISNIDGVHLGRSIPMKPKCLLCAAYTYDAERSATDSKEHKCDICWECRRSPNVPDSVVDDVQKFNAEGEPLPSCLCLLWGITPNRGGNTPLPAGSTQQEYGKCSGGSAWYPVGGQLWPPNGRIPTRGM